MADKDKRFDKIFVLAKLVLNKILAPDVFDYGDSKSESWHRARKIREEKFSLRTFFSNGKSCLFWPPL